MSDTCITPSIDAFGTIMLFDGVCNLCNGVVQFLLRIEKDDALRFGTLQSKDAAQLLTKLNAPLDLSTVVYVRGSKLYTHSTAVSMLLRHHGKPFWVFLGWVLICIPRPIRDFGYRIVAGNRYKWFGRKDACMLPRPELTARFLPSDS